MFALIGDKMKIITPNDFNARAEVLGDSLVVVIDDAQEDSHQIPLTGLNDWDFLESFCIFVTRKTLLFSGALQGRPYLRVNLAYSLATKAWIPADQSGSNGAEVILKCPRPSSKVIVPGAHTYSFGLSFDGRGVAISQLNGAKKTNTAWNALASNSSIAHYLPAPLADEIFPISTPSDERGGIDFIYQCFPGLAVCGYLPLERTPKESVVALACFTEPVHNIHDAQIYWKFFDFVNLSCVPPEREAELSRLIPKARIENLFRPVGINR